MQLMLTCVKTRAIDMARVATDYTDNLPIGVIGWRVLAIMLFTRFIAHVMHAGKNADRRWFLRSIWKVRTSLAYLTLTSFLTNISRILQS